MNRNLSFALIAVVAAIGVATDAAAKSTVTLSGSTSVAPLAKELAHLFGRLEQELREGIGADQVDRALLSGAANVDLHVAMPRQTGATIGRLVEMLDLADEFCREERMLSLARTPQQQRFQRWFLEEFVRQEQGEAPLAWQDAAVCSRQNSMS